MNRHTLEDDPTGACFLWIVAFIREAGGDFAFNRSFFSFHYFRELHEEARVGLNDFSLRLNEDFLRSSSGARPSEDQLQLYKIAGADLIVDQHYHDLYGAHPGSPKISCPRPAAEAPTHDATPRSDARR